MRTPFPRVCLLKARRKASKIAFLPSPQSCESRRAPGRSDCRTRTVGRASDRTRSRRPTRTGGSECGAARLPHAGLGVPELDADPAWRLAAAFLLWLERRSPVTSFARRMTGPAVARETDTITVLLSWTEWVGLASCGSCRVFG